MLETLQNWDSAIFRLLNEARFWAGDRLCEVASMTPAVWGLGLLIPVFILIWYGRKAGSRKILHMLLLLAVAVGLSDMATNMLKEASGRVRPKDAMAGVYYMQGTEWRRQTLDFAQTRERGYSMPSSHAANSMAAAVVIGTVAPPLAPVMVAVSFASGYSRVYKARHYPLDVLAGWLLGLCIAGATTRAWKAVLPRVRARYRKKPEAAILLPVQRPPIFPGRCLAYARKAMQIFLSMLRL